MSGEPQVERVLDMIEHFRSSCDWTGTAFFAEQFKCSQRTVERDLFIVERRVPLESMGTGNKIRYRRLR